MHLEKARGIYGDEAKSFEASLVPKDDSLIWATKDIEDVLAEQVAALTAEGMSVRDIADELDTSKSKVGRIQKRLKEAA